MKHKILSFYTDWLLPEIVDSRQARGMPFRENEYQLVKSTDTSSDDNKENEPCLKEVDSLCYVYAKRTKHEPNTIRLVWTDLQARTSALQAFRSCSAAFRLLSESSNTPGEELNEEKLNNNPIEDTDSGGPRAVRVVRLHLAPVKRGRRNQPKRLLKIVIDRRSISSANKAARAACGAALIRDVRGVKSVVGRRSSIPTLKLRAPASVIRAVSLVNDFVDDRCPSCCTRSHNMSQNTARYREVLLEFISIYQSELCLWKVKSEIYHNRDQRNAALEKLLTKYKEVDAEANRDAVLKKINSLRTAYQKEKKKVEESKRSGAGTDAVYVPKLWYYKELSFINDQNVARASVSNMDEKEGKRG
ncbi:hypothetical protein EVAR_10266_1 [Eumeta japonica]|uniref:MADF domain-containing protein n=1 Tax=Eumeta variegata TaxID=151549 RepID=A0A4C1TGP7_EUMVA|nr:hypothetical protein EVAR_10266_1 [Eumeta japonica]